MADNIEIGAAEIASLLDKGQSQDAAERLRSDYLNMGREDFARLVRSVNSSESKRNGIDIELADSNKDGIPEVTLVDSDSGIGPWFENRELVIGTESQNFHLGLTNGPAYKLAEVMVTDPYRHAVIEQQ